MKVKKNQQGAALFTLLFFLPVIGWLSSISWQSIQLHLDTTERHREQQHLITQAQQALLMAEDILETEHTLPFSQRCIAGRCLAVNVTDENNFTTLQNRSDPATIQSYLLEKNQRHNLNSNTLSTRYKIHILITHSGTQQKIHLSAIYKIRQGAAIRQSWLLEKSI